MKTLKIKEKPPYPSYKSFRNYIIKLKETGVPAQIDRGVFGNQSGTYISCMIGAFKWLRLIDVNDMPTVALHELVDADDAGYQAKLKELLLSSYQFLADGKIDLKKGTTTQIKAIFTELGMSGSTLTKSIGFFLAAAKEAGYTIGSHMKAPPPPRAPVNGKKKKNKPDEKTGASGDENDLPDELENMEKITVPLRDMDDGVIYFPKSLDTDDAKKAVNMAVFILNNFYGID